MPKDNVYMIFHLINNLGMGGAQTMSYELYHSFNKYYPQYPQKFIYQSDKLYNSKLVSSYKVPCSKMDDNKIVKKINSCKNVIVIYHKLASSDCRIVEQINTKTNAETIVINHTLYQSSNWRNFKKFSIMIAVSKHMNNKIAKWYPKINHDFIRNGVDGSRYENIKAAGISKKDIFLTGRINRICAWKFSNDWVKWCTSVKLPKKMVHEFIGSPISGRRSNKVQSLKGRNKVKMIGGIDDFKTKVAMIKNFDVFLYEVNRDEGISMAILEAMACSVPVICSDHFGNKEIIKNGINGYVFKDRKQAQKILSDLIKHPEKLKELKKTTKQYFDEHLDAKHTAKKYVEIMYRISGKKGVVEKCEEKPIEIVEKVKDPIDIKPIKNNKFTVITSGYNKGKNLDDWTSSIIRQKYRPLEVVFANDRSTDDTLARIKDIEKKFKNNNIEFKLVDNDKQLYCGGSYHNLVNYISGFYAGVLDADDMLAEDAVEYVMSLYKRHPDIYWIYTQFLWCNEKMKKGRTGTNRCPEKGESLLDLGDRKIHGIGTGFRTFSKKIKRPDKLFGKHLTCAVDKNMGYRLEEAGPGLFTDRECYIHRGHPIDSKDSVSSTRVAMEKWKQVIKEAHNRRKKYNKIIYPIIKI